MKPFAKQPPALTSALSYALIDGILQQWLIEHPAGDRNAIAEMQKQVRPLLARL